MPKRVIRGNSNCDKCDLCNVGDEVCIMGSGPIKNTRIMVIGDAVSFAEDYEGEAFRGKSAVFLRKLLKNNGINHRELYFTHAVKCKTPEGKPPSAKQIKACSEYLQTEIRIIKPEIILVLGAVALKAALGKAKITEIHGNAIEHKDGITYFPVFSPGMALRDPRKRGPIEHDLKRFAQLVRGEKGTEHKLKFTLVNSIESLKELILELDRCTEFAYDVETTGLNRFASDAAITMYVIATKNGEWVIPFNYPPFSYFSTHESQRLIVEMLVRYSKGKLAIAQNGKFDDLYTETHYDDKLELGFDTMLSSHLLDENSPQGLKYSAQKYLDAHSWDIDLDKKKSKILTQQAFTEICEYAAWDGHFTLRLKWCHESLLKKDESLYKLYWKMTMPVVRAYENIEKNGVYLNLDKLQQIKIKTRKQMKVAVRSLNTLYDHYYRKNKWNALGLHKPLENVNWNSAPQVGKILFNHLGLEPEGYTPKGDPSTGAALLTRMIGQHKILTPLLEYRHAMTLMSSFIEGWEKRLVNDRYLYPGFKVSGTVTGRPSSSDPNLQQVPQNVDIRSVISSPEGWVFFEIDYSQLELRIAAHISGDSEMLRVYQTGGDIHAETASGVSGIPLEEVDKQQRRHAKPVNFGFIYGMGWRTFKDYALDKYGVVLTDSQSKVFRKRYFEKYSGLPGWHNRQRRIVRSLGQVRTLTGRIRRLPEINSPDQGLQSEAERSAINSPVQGFGAEMALMALVDLDKILNAQEVKVCGTIHDSLVGRVRLDRAFYWLPRIKMTMENPSLLKDFGINLSVPIVADVSIGDWGLGDEVEAPGIDDEHFDQLLSEGWEYNVSANLFENEHANQLGYFTKGEFKTRNY